MISKRPKKEHSRGDILIWTLVSRDGNASHPSNTKIICLVLGKKRHPQHNWDGYRILVLETNTPSVPMNTIWIAKGSPISTQSEKVGASW
jgi:hypothetical protein